MPVFIVILVALLLLLLFGPNYWAQHTFRRFSKPRDDIPGNGAQFARHLLDKLEMSHVKVEETRENGDHYDPRDKAVRLSPKNYSDKSLTAITVAAHEVGHAIQDHQNDRMHHLRGRLVGIANVVQQIGAGILVVLPFAALITRSPVIGVLFFLAGMATMGISSIVHLVTLPVELDASFNKALPILFKGNYIDEKDRPAARKILRAAALTYVAASLASLLNLARWIAILRR